MIDPAFAAQLVLLLHADGPAVTTSPPIEISHTISTAQDRARVAAAVAELPTRVMLGLRYVAVGRHGPFRGRDLLELRVRPWWSRGGLRIDIRFGAWARWS
jgi:hypothetical protein